MDQSDDPEDLPAEATPDMLEAVVDLDTELADASGAHPDSLGDALLRVRALINREVVRVASQLASVQDWVRKVWLEAAPDNWHRLGSRSSQIIEFMERTNLCLVWVPSHESVVALLATQQPEATLIELTDPILASLDQTLARARIDAFQEHNETCDMAAEAIAAFRAGHLRAAQCLAAAGLSHVFTLLGHRKLKNAQAEFRKQKPRRSTIHLLRRALLQACSVPVLDSYPDDHHPQAAQRPRPVGFNRNATQHGEVWAFSEANALAALMLLVGWLRELTFIAENHPEAIQEV